MKLTRPAIAVAISITLAAISNPASAAVDHAAVLTPYLNDDTFGVYFVNVASLPDTGNTAEMFQLAIRLPKEAQQQLLGAMMISGLVNKFRLAGGQGVYLVAGLSDIHEDAGPLLIATAAPNRHLEEVERMFKDLIKNLHDDPNQVRLHRLTEILEVRRRGDAVLVGTKATVDRYTTLTPSERNDFIEPITRLTSEGAIIAHVFAPGPDFRRVVRELWPTLPPPMTPLKGDLADRWRTLEFAANLPPNANPRIIIHTTDRASAQTFVDLYHALPAAVEQITELGEQRHELKRYLETMVALLSAQIDDTRVTLSLSPAPPQLENLGTMLAGLTNKALASSRNGERMDRFRQLLLAMLNYSDVNKHLPPAAICDKNGRPLLSWRVAILPYIEQNELYKQFHLDEPWDSPHNRTLIDKMPQLYADPDPQIRQTAGPGKTTCLVPVAAETIFFHSEGTALKEIPDGTAKTLMLVEVEPLRAAIWTKPEDWNVDLLHPRQGLERSDRSRFAAGFADSTVVALPTDLDDATLRAMLTRAGGETFDWP
jgi:hypothetical protein